MLKLKCLLHSASVWMLDETERSLLPSWSRWRLLVVLLFVDATLVGSLVSNEVLESLASPSALIVQLVTVVLTCQLMSLSGPLVQRGVTCWTNATWLDVCERTQRREQQQQVNKNKIKSEFEFLLRLTIALRRSVAVRLRVQLALEQLHRGGASDLALSARHAHLLGPLGHQPRSSPLVVG